MPIALPSVDLSTATIGSKGSIDLTRVMTRVGPAYENKPAYLRLLNESGCGISISYQDRGGDSFYVIAGDRPLIPIYPGESALLYTVIYVLANPQISMLLAILYQPGETIPDAATLGNSPVGGTIVTTSATALNLIASDSKETVYLDDVNFAGVNVLVPSQYPKATGAVDIGLAAQTGPASAILALVTNGAANQIQMRSHLGLALGSLYAAGWQVYSGTGTQIGFNHGLGATPQIALITITNQPDTWWVGNYTSTTVDVHMTTGTTQWKMLIIV